MQSMSILDLCRQCLYNVLCMIVPQIRLTYVLSAQLFVQSEEVFQKVCIYTHIDVLILF